MSYNSTGVSLTHKVTQHTDRICTTRDAHTPSLLKKKKEVSQMWYRAHFLELECIDKPLICYHRFPRGCTFASRPVSNVVVSLIHYRGSTISLKGYVLIGTLTSLLLLKKKKEVSQMGTSVQLVGSSSRKAWTARCLDSLCACHSYMYAKNDRWKKQTYNRTQKN